MVIFKQRNESFPFLGAVHIFLETKEFSKGAKSNLWLLCNLSGALDLRKQFFFSFRFRQILSPHPLLLLVLFRIIKQNSLKRIRPYCITFHK